MKCRQIREDVKRNFIYEVSTGQCYRSKQKAVDIINGKLVDHYERVRDYTDEILESNP